MNTAVVECLVAARKRIEDPAKWGKGPEVFAEDPENNKDCAEWAIYRTVRDNFGTDARNAVLMLRKAIGEESIVGWNDTPERTHEDVLAAYDKAIEIARQD